MRGWVWEKVVAMNLYNYCRMPRISVLQEFITDVGFTQGPVIILTDILFKPEHWHNKEGPFKKEWRNTVR